LISICIYISVRIVQLCTDLYTVQQLMISGVHYCKLYRKHKVHILYKSTIVYLYSVKLHLCRSKVQATQVAGRQVALQARGLISVVVELMVPNSSFFS